MLGSANNVRSKVDKSPPTTTVDVTEKRFRIGTIHRMSNNIGPVLTKNSQQLELCKRDVLGSLRDAEAANNQRATAMLLNNLALVYHAEGRFVDADLTHKRCVSILESLTEPRSVAQSLANRAALYRTFGHYH